MIAAAGTILLVDDDGAFLQVLARALRRRGWEVYCASDPATALRICDEHAPDRAIVDLKLDNDSGLQLIPRLIERFPDIDIVMLTGYSSIATAVEAVKLGATNYLCKPAGADDILAAFEQSGPDAPPPPADQPPSLERLEWEHIQRVLTENGGNISATARQLGMHRRTLQRKLGKKPVKR